MVLVHERLALRHGVGVVVVAQALVAGQARGHRLVATIHRHQVDVDVDEEVRGGGPLVDLDVLALVGEAEMDELVGILGVVLPQQAVGGEGVEDALAQRVTKLGVGHASVQCQRRDQHHVVDAGLGRQLEDLLDDELAHVGPAHGGQGQRHVVEGDGELHAGPQLGPQRGDVAQGLVERPADGADGVGQGVHRLRGVEHPGPDGQLLEPVPLAVPEQGGGGGVVDFEDEAGPGAHGTDPFVLGPVPRWRCRARRSKTTFTAPRRPAAPAWARASSKRSSG